VPAGLPYDGNKYNPVRSHFRSNLRTIDNHIQEPSMPYHRTAYTRDSREGLPEHAVERLSRGAKTEKGFFTSDLTVNEFVLLHQAGFEPLGLVMGTSMYQIGYQRAGWTQNIEMDVLTQAMYNARELAMTRMEEEADVLGADGIVGVRLDVIRHAWGASM